MEFQNPHILLLSVGLFILSSGAGIYLLALAYKMFSENWPNIKKIINELDEE